jgi:hypothetical protein
MSSVFLDFYSVTTEGDGISVETLLYDQVGGTLEVGRQIVSDDVNQTSFIQMYTFFPSKILLGITFGLIAKDGDIVYSVQNEEIYSDHQEIYLRKNNL